MIRKGATSLAAAFKTAGLKAISGRSGIKVFPYTSKAGTVFVKNTDKLSIVVHPQWKRELTSLGANVKDYKNANLSGFPDHVATTGEKYGLAVDFTSVGEAVKLVRAIEAKA